MVYRIDDTTAVSALPALPTDDIGTPGYFTGGSTGGLSATRLRYWWLNMVQEELAAIAQVAGATLDKSNNGQVLAAIQSLIAAAGATAASNLAAEAAARANAVSNEAARAETAEATKVSGTFGMSGTDAQVQSLLWGQVTDGSWRPLIGYGDVITNTQWNALALYSDVKGLPGAASMHDYANFLPVSGQTETLTMEMDCPNGGVIMVTAQANVSGAGVQPAACTLQLWVNGVVYSKDSTQAALNLSGAGGVAAGTVTVAATYTAGTSTGTFNNVGLNLSAICVPSP